MVFTVVGIIMLFSIGQFKKVPLFNVVTDGIFTETKLTQFAKVSSPGRATLVGKMAFVML